MFFQLFSGKVKFVDKWCKVIIFVILRVKRKKCLFLLFLPEFKVTRPSFFLGGGYHPTLKLSGIPTFTFIVSLTHRIDNI